MKQMLRVLLKSHGREENKSAFIITHRVSVFKLSIALPFCVRLKIESLSGLTDFVVSITNVRGGLMIFDFFGDFSHS